MGKRLRGIVHGKINMMKDEFYKQFHYYLARIAVTTFMLG